MSIWTRHLLTLWRSPRTPGTCVKKRLIILSWGGRPDGGWQLSRCWHVSVHGVVKCLVALSQADWAWDLPLVATAPAPRHPLLKHYTVQWRTVLYCAHRQSRLHLPATGQELPRWTLGITNTESHYKRTISLSCINKSIDKRYIECKSWKYLWGNIFFLVSLILDMRA